jgi:hypothetical protein
MPVWMIEYFGRQQLDQLLWLLLFMTAPAWLAMLLLPGNRTVRRIASPFILPLLYLPVLVYLVATFHDKALLPPPPAGADFRAFKGLVVHPVAILIVLCTVQIAFLAIGTLIYQQACRLKIRAPVEILLAWLSGPLALAPFAIRTLPRR